MIAAVEDALSEAVVRKIVSFIRPEITITSVLGKRGKGYLESKARELNRSATTLSVFLLVDQDSPSACPVDVIHAWLGGAPQRQLLFRFAVLEVESWLLGDRTNLASFLGIPEHRLPQVPDSLPQPKETLVQLARTSRIASIRDDLVPTAGGTAVVGPAYNPRMISFVESRWNPAAAADSSPSLHRALTRLRAV